MAKQKLGTIRAALLSIVEELERDRGRRLHRQDTSDAQVHEDLLKASNWVARAQRDAG